MINQIVTKAKIRSEKRAARKALTSTQVRKFSNEIVRNFLSNFDLAKYRHMHIYIPIDAENEVDTKLLIKHIEDHRYDLKLSFPLKKPIIAKDVDIVIVPVIAFDSKLNRIGFGGGYYDRLLVKVNPECSKIGFAYEESRVTSIPIDDHDIPLDAIITQNGVVSI